mgnify:FL=1
MKAENILSVKLNKKDRSSVVNVSYFYPELNRNRDEEITDVPHKDFYAAINKLTTMLSSVFYAVDDDKYSATGFKKVKDDVVQITGKVITANEGIIGISTPSINLNDDHFGFEEELRDATDNICLETLMLLNGSKLGVQQLTIDAAIAANANKIAEGDQNLFEKNLAIEEQTDEIDHDNAVDEEFPDVDSFTDTDKHQ